MKVMTRHRLTEAAWPAGLGPGWRELLRRLDRQLEELDPRCFIWRVDIDGLLRVSYEAPPELRDRADALVAAAEHRAAATCETCGDPGTVRAGPVVSVLCDSCTPSR